MAKVKRTMEQRMMSRIDPGLHNPQDREQYKMATFAGRGRGFGTSKAKPMSFKPKK